MEHILMIQESRVLFGVQHLEECTGRIAIMATTNLVHFIDKNEGVFSSNALQSLDDLAR